LCLKDPTLGNRLEQEKADAAYENLCRLYVGMTRAEYSLVLISIAPEKPDPTKKKKEEDVTNYNFAELLEAVIGTTKAKTISLKDCADGEIVWQTGDDNWVKMLGSQKPEETISQKPVIPTFTPVTKIERLRPSAQSHYIAAPFRSRTEQMGANHSGKELGTLVHQLFQNLEWDIEAFLGQLQAPAKSSTESFKFARQLIEGCLKSKAVTNLLIPKSLKPELWRERSVALMFEGKMIDAVFDRVHIIPGKEAVIIDYKTNDCSEAHLKELYEGQMKLYRLSVAELCGIPPEKIRCVLIHVRNGTLVEV
jgi:ATP-dependent helicase/nuclease subunit A